MNIFALCRFDQLCIYTHNMGCYFFMPLFSREL